MKQKPTGNILAKKDSLFSGMTRKAKRNCFVLAVLIPFAVWMLIYMLIPLASVIFYSFTDAKMAYDDFSWVGLYQFKKLFSSADAITSIVNSVKAALIIMPISLVLSMLTAVGLNALSDRFRNLYTFAYFVPNIMSMTAICLVWNWMYHNSYGIINAFLNLFGMENQQFLKSAEQALFCLCIIHIWSVFGYYAVILLAAIRGIDKSLYEAADIFGANAWQKFWYVTMPMLKNQLLFVCIMLTTSAFMFFTPVKVLTDGTPGNSTLVMLLYVHRRGIQQGDIAHASAMSLVLMAIILFFSLLQWVLTKEPAPKDYSKPVKSKNRKEVEV
jgi:ABC-type sugar transport system permease subunit